MLLIDLEYLLKYFLRLLDVWIWTSNIIRGHCVVDSYYLIISVFIDGEKLSVRN